MGKCKWIKQWIEEESDFCRPCLLPPLMAWYKEELEERGYRELSQEIDRASQTGDENLVAEVLDKIKEKVPQDLRERLEEFDCAAQAFAEEQEK